MVRTLESILKKRYLAADVYISNKEVYIKWFAGNEGDTITASIYDVIKGAFFPVNKLPKEWESAAAHWVLAGISIEQVEELLSIKAINLPKKFYKYVKKVDNDYYDYCMTQLQYEPYI